MPTDTATDSFINLAHAMLVAIGLVYLIMVILFRSLLVPFVILSALIGLPMLRGIVVTNAIVLLAVV
jgi:multidrug efflux pump subunit AcrB